MTSRSRTNLKLAAINATEIPANRPVIMESSSSTAAWQRERLNAMDECDLIDAQIASAERTFENTKNEATAVRDARIATADRAMEREIDDGSKILEATVAALKFRKDDLGRVISGLDAAIGASSADE